MDDDFPGCGFDLNGDGKLDLVERSIEMDDFESTLGGSGGSSSAYRRKPGRGFKIFILIIALSVVCFLFEKIPDMITGIENRAAYRKAEKMISVEDYSGALSELGNVLVEYKDSDGLEALCMAHKYEAEGDFGMAYAYLYDAEFHYQNAAQMRRIKDFKSRMEQAFYDEVDREIEEESKEDCDSLDLFDDNEADDNDLFGEDYDDDIFR